MAFPTGYEGDPQNGVAGSLHGNNNVVLTASKGNWLSGVKVGRFCILKSDKIQNADGSATPVVAGITLRSPSNPVESGETFDASITPTFEYLRAGMATVQARGGEAVPKLFDTIYMSNQGDASDGMATGTDTDILTQAEFIQDLGGFLWLVRLKDTVNA